MPDCLFVLAAWGAWLAYWGLSARGGKPLARRESVLSRAAQTMPITVGGLPVLIPDLGWRGFDSHMTAPLPATGMALLAGGLAFTIWARRCLGDNWSADVAIREGHELVRSGPYRMVRHPIYTGGVVAVAGCVLMGGQWRGLAGFVLVLGTLAYKLRMEEQWLSRQFGGSYARYRSEVPALVPVPWRTVRERR